MGAASISDRIPPLTSEPPDPSAARRATELPMPVHPRPLSPHLQVYRWQITMTMSILHRVSGVALTIGAFGLVAWLLAVATGGETFERAARLLDSPFGLVVLAGFSLALIYHLLNGIRHLFWDVGMGYETPQVYRSGYAVAGLTIVLTVLVWWLALAARGAA